LDKYNKIKINNENKTKNCEKEIHEQKKENKKQKIKK